MRRWRTAAVCAVMVSVLFIGGAICIDAVDGEKGRTHLIDGKLVADYGTQGTKGRLIFDSAHSVALYCVDETEYYRAQDIVDAEDSAAWFMWCGSESPIIADHCTQAFEVLRDCVVGDVCYVIDGDSVQAFECIRIDNNAINERTDMVLSDGSSFMRGTAHGFLYMYTCNEAGNPRNITVVIWIPMLEGSDWTGKH